MNMSFKFVCPSWKKVRVSVFYRGKVNILGAHDVETPLTICDYISTLFHTHWSEYVVLQPLPDKANWSTVLVGLRLIGFTIGGQIRCLQSPGLMARSYKMVYQGGSRYCGQCLGWSPSRGVGCGSATLAQLCSPGCGTSYLRVNGCSVLLSSGGVYGWWGGWRCSRTVRRLQSAAWILKRELESRSCRSWWGTPWGRSTPVATTRQYPRGSAGRDVDTRAGGPGEGGGIRTGRQNRAPSPSGNESEGWSRSSRGRREPPRSGRAVKPPAFRQ